MSISKTILVMNGASSSELAPNYIAIVQKKGTEYHLLVEEKTNLKGGPERFPIYFQSFINQGIMTADQIDLIAVMVGPGSFTGLRASIAFALGMQVGLNCPPAIGLRRGESLFPFIDFPYSEKLIWHVTYARRGRIFVETNKSEQVIAYNEGEISFPDEAFVIMGEAVAGIESELPKHAEICHQYYEANSIMMAKLADRYNNEDKLSNNLYPLYVDPPEAKLPQKGLRKAPV